MNGDQTQIDPAQLKGLSVLLAGFGTIDIHRSIQASMVEFGCEVLWTVKNPNDKHLHQRIDIVFHLDILSLGVKYINRLRKNLDAHNRDAIIINIPLSHPIISINSLGLKSVTAINAFFRDRRIIMWSMCLTSLKEFEQYGLWGGVFEPLGINDYYLLTKDRRQLRETWINQKTTFQKVSYDYAYDPAIDNKETLVKDKIVYAGVPNSSWETLLPPNVLSKTKFLEDTFFPNSKEIFLQELNVKIEPDNMEGFLHFHHLWSLHIPLQRRRNMVRLVTENFANHVSIWGNGWEKFITRCHSTSVVPRYFYQKALCCLDFGSTQFDTPLFPRTCEIIKMDGLLISGKSDDRVELIEENQFQTGEQMLTIIDDAFDKKKRRIKMDKQKTLRRTHNFAKTILNVLGKIYKII